MVYHVNITHESWNFAYNTTSVEKDGKIFSPSVLQVNNNNMTKTLIEEIINHETFFRPFTAVALNSMTWWMHFTYCLKHTRVHKPPCIAFHSLTSSCFVSVYIISLRLVPWENPSPANCGTSTMWNGIQRHSESQTSAVAFGFSSQCEPVASWVMTVPLSLSDRATYTLKLLSLLLRRRYETYLTTQTGVIPPLQSTTHLQ